MADFFSRIFAIPSDSNSSSSGSYTDESKSAAAPRDRKKKRGHARTLTPLSAGANTSSVLSTSIEKDNISVSSASASFEEDDRRRRHRSISSKHKQTRTSSTDNRGRQRRSGSSGGEPAGHRSASEPRRHEERKERSDLTSQKRSSSKNKFKSSSHGSQSKQTNGKSRRSLSKLRSSRGSGGAATEEIGEYDSFHRQDHSPAHDTSPMETTDENNGHHHRRSSNSPSNNNSYASSPHDTIDSQKKLKKRDWRSKLTGGMKKHLSPTSQSTPPLAGQRGVSSKGKSRKVKSKQQKQQHSSSRVKDNHARGLESHRLNFPPQINVGDSIVISQQFLEESAEMSVVTLPRELAMKEDGVSFDADGDMMQEVGQNAVQSFLERRNNGAVIGGGGGERDIPKLASHDSRGQSYERINSYANRLVEEGNIYRSHSQSGEYHPSFHDETGDPLQRQQYGLYGEEIELRRSDSHASDMTPGKHAWPCDPTAEGYSPREGNEKTLQTGVIENETQQMLPLNMPPPPPPPPPGVPPNQRGIRVDIPNGSPQTYISSPRWANSINRSDSMDGSKSTIDPAGLLLTSPTNDESPTSRRQKADPPASGQLPFDESSSGLGAAHLHPQDSSTNKQHRSNKAVTFCLPPPSSHPPAPPFLGPPNDFYYSMERGSKDPMPCWSSSPLMPPIVELWSSVENNTDCEIGGAIGGNMISGWESKKENSLVGEELPLFVSEEWLDANHSQSVDNDDHRAASKESQSSQEASKKDPILSSRDHYFDDILACGGDDELTTEIDSLKLSISSDSGRPNPECRLVSNPSEELSSDANFRHRSAWKSSHGAMSYKPPMFANGDGSPSKGGSATRQPLDDGVLFDETMQQDHHSRRNDNKNDYDRPVVLHGRVVRANVASQHNNRRQPKTAHSSSFSFQGSASSAAVDAAVSIQSFLRGMLQRHQFNLMMNSVLIIQSYVRRFLFRQRCSTHLKLKRSYFPNAWKRNQQSRRRR